MHNLLKKTNLGGEVMKYSDTIKFLQYILEATKANEIAWTSFVLDTGKVKYSTELQESNLKVILIEQDIIPCIFISTPTNTLRLYLKSSDYDSLSVYPAEEIALELQIKLLNRNREKVEELVSRFFKNSYEKLSSKSNISETSNE